MKSFNNELGMTLIELIISITIWVVVYVIIFSFVADSTEEMISSSLKTEVTDEWFIFKDKLNRYIISWLSYMQVFTGSTNSILYLRNQSWDKAVIFWVVNKSTMKIQPDYIYENNFIWYRNLSIPEINQIDTNSGAVYDLNFHNDKVFFNMRIKDFNVILYNNDSIVDIFFSVINRKDENNFWMSLDEISVNPLDLQEFNLNF